RAGRPAAGDGSGLFTWRIERPILPSRTLSTFTLTMSSGFKYSLMSWTYVSAISEMCTRPVFPSPSSTKAPKLVMPVTLPSRMLPTSMDIRKRNPPLRCCPAGSFVQQVLLLYVLRIFLSIYTNRSHAADGSAALGCCRGRVDDNDGRLARRDQPQLLPGDALDHFIAVVASQLFLQHRVQPPQLLDFLLHLLQLGAQG